MGAERALTAITPGRLAAKAGARLRSHALSTCIALAAAGAAHAQNAPGDILLCICDVNSRIERIHTDGSSAWTSSGGSGWNWEGCSLTAQGNVVTTRRGPAPPGVLVFDPNGVLVNSFLTPEVISIPGDVSVFSDGTIAVVGQNGVVYLYTEAGTFITSTVLAAGFFPFGTCVDRHDRLFVSELTWHGLYVGRISKLNRTGQVIGSIALPFSPGDLVVAPDDTLWVTDRQSGMLYHLDASGAQLNQFPVVGVGSFEGLALADDGTIYAAGESSTQILHFSDTGALLGTLPIPGSGGVPCFMSSAGCHVDPAVYCTAKVNSIGCTPVISATGSASPTASSGFTVSAADVRNQKAGLLLYGVSGRDSVPFQGGFLCVAAPVRRSTAANSGGTPQPANDCSGVYTIDMNRFARGLLGGSPLPALSTAGTFVDCQWWGRDPGFPFPGNSTLSGGLEYVICPR